MPTFICRHTPFIVRAHLSPFQPPPADFAGFQIIHNLYFWYLPLTISMTFWEFTPAFQPRHAISFEPGWFASYVVPAIPERAILTSRIPILELSIWATVSNARGRLARRQRAPRYSTHQPNSPAYWRLFIINGAMLTKKMHERFARDAALYILLLLPGQSNLRLYERRRFRYRLITSHFWWINIGRQPRNHYHIRARYWPCTFWFLHSANWYVVWA